MSLIDWFPRTAVKYEKWMKVYLDNKITNFLAECYLELLPEKKILLKVFDHGYFLMDDQDKYLDSHEELRDKYKKNGKTPRINLAICKVKEKVYYRIFVTYGYYGRYRYRHTERYSIQISEKEKIFNETIEVPNITNFILKSGCIRVNDKYMKQRPLTKDDQIIRDWQRLEKYLDSIDLPNHESFNTQLPST